VLRLAPLLAPLYSESDGVHFNSALQARLTRLAAQRGRGNEELVLEAVERLVDYDEWFIRKVEKGLGQVERGELLPHEEVGARSEKLLTQHQSRA
jgi:predicted transcriptional regulator